MLEIKIKTDYIKLDQLLKYAGIVQTGGQASIMIDDEMVSVNGQVTSKRGHKIKRGDIVEIEDFNQYIVI